jgi:hypothetical protein
MAGEAVADEEPEGEYSHFLQIVMAKFDVSHFRFSTSRPSDFGRTS